MVSFVIVSHSAKLADGVCDIAKMSAPSVPMFIAGGLEDGSYGTSLELIIEAINKANNKDGVIVLTDMGSAVMTAEMAIESLNISNIKMIDCPIVAGAVTGTVLSEAGSTLEEIEEELKNL